MEFIIITIAVIYVLILMFNKETPKDVDTMHPISYTALELYRKELEARRKKGI